MLNETSRVSESTLPTGTLTFLLTDIEESTRLWERAPEQMRLAMLRHDALIETAIARFGGKIVRPRGEGDSRFAVFPRATNAVEAAAAIQRLLADEPWDLPAKLRVRIGMHTGDVDLRDGEYYGTAVNRCARLRSVAHGGQTLISQVTFRLAEEELPQDLSLRDLGEHRLKSLKRPEHIYQLIIPGLQEDFPALQTQHGPQTNLPLTLTSFIGRGHELAELKELLSTFRLVTITGAGGLGKTRLALQAGPDLLDSFSDGVWFIDLAPLSNPGLVSQEVATVLGIHEEGGLRLDQALTGALKDRALLLIFDNCEHLLPEMSSLTEKLLREAPKIKILATSRQPLGTPGEKVWWLPTLTCPGSDEDFEPEKLLEYEAIKLFVERARAVSGDFKFNRQNAQAVVQVCAHLDGIPLAIELAVARLRILTVEEIAERLNDRFRLLVAEHATQQRQQTLRLLVDWSYDLLSESERLLLRRLSVFSDGFTLQAAEQVCSGGEVKPTQVFDLLSHLIDKSFVIPESSQEGKRFRFLETIHHYSRERLDESGESAESFRRHAAFYLNMAEQASNELRGPRQEYWLPRLDVEYDNLRLAMDWMAQEAAPEAEQSMAQEADREEMLLRMANALWPFWKIRGYFSEGRFRLMDAINRYPDAPAAMLALALRGAGMLAVQQGDYAEAKALNEKSLKLYSEIGDKAGIARAFSILGEIAQFQGRYLEAIDLNQESLALRFEIGDKQGMAETLGKLGILGRDRGRYQQAIELLEESLELSLEVGDKQMVALAQKDLGIIAYYLCEYPKANRLLEEAVSLYHELNDRPGVSDTQQALGNVAKAQGDFLRAAALYDKSLEIKQELGDKRGIAQVVADMAEVAFYQGKYPRAVKFAEESLASFRELGAKRGAVLSLGIRAFTACFQGDYPLARSVAEECLALSTEINAPRPVAYCKEVFGLVAYAHGELEAAKAFFQEAMDIFQSVGDRRNIAGVLVNLARTAYRQGDREAATKYLNESLSLSQKLEIRWTVGFLLEIMGLLDRSEGDMAQACELFKESLKLSAEQDNQQGIANCLGALAGLAVLANQPTRAARLFAAGEKIRRLQGMSMGEGDRREYEGYMTSLRAQLGHRAFDDLIEEGNSVSLEEIMRDLKDWPASWWAQSMSAEEI